MTDLNKSLIESELDNDSERSGIAFFVGLAITALIAGALLFVDSLPRTNAIESAQQVPTRTITPQG
jgi:hypothetical protein